MDKEKIEELKERRKKLQEEVRLIELRKRIAYQIAHLEKLGQSYTVYYEGEAINWIYSTIQVRKKDGYFGIHGDFQIDVDDSTAIETVKMKEEEIDSDKFRDHFTALIPSNRNVIVCYDGGDPELEISASSFLSQPSLFLAAFDAWVITTDKSWAVEFIGDQDAIRFIQLKGSTPWLIKKIKIEG